MLPRPTPLTEPDREADPQDAGRLLSVLAALIAAGPRRGPCPRPRRRAAPPSPPHRHRSDGGQPVGRRRADPRRHGRRPVGYRSGRDDDGLVRLDRRHPHHAGVEHPGPGASPRPTPPAVVNVRVATPAGSSPVVVARPPSPSTPFPTVGALSSRSASTRGGTTVTLTGTGLQRTSSVLFGTTAAAGLTRISATQVRVTVPAHPRGPSTCASRRRAARRPSPPRAASATPPRPSSRRRRSRACPCSAGPVRGGTVIVAGRDQLHRDDHGHLRWRRRAGFTRAVRAPSCGSRPRPARPAPSTSRSAPRPVSHRPPPRTPTPTRPSRR